IERITLYEPGDDHDLVRTHPTGLRLHHSPATGTSTATTPDGRVVAQISGMRATVLARVPARPRTATAETVTTAVRAATGPTADGRRTEDDTP
ncbi:hypothetical protein, partial [Streptomyces sp. sk2.1]